MDELRGPNVQLVLHIKEGVGFGFLKSPFIVTGSLNGYVLETDPVVPCHAPVFDAELVWEADKRKFRKYVLSPIESTLSLRVQNVPLKVEVHSTGTQGRKNKVGYLLLSLLGAQPCPTGKVVNINQAWHKLLGVWSEGKCCHPQLMISLTVEDRANTPTPRNELTLFHSNELATLNFPSAGGSTVRVQTFTLEDYLIESKRVAKSEDLNPRLLCNEGLIQIGASKEQEVFVLSFVIGSAENIDILLPETAENESQSCHVTYSVFTHTIQTDRFPTTTGGVKKTMVQFNQRSSLKLCSDLSSLSRYLAECPYVVIRLCSGEQDVGVSSIDLRKLIMTDDITTFLNSFCNSDNAITICERCFMLSCKEACTKDERKPFVDIEISLKYAGPYKENVLKPGLTARSASQLECKGDKKEDPPEIKLDKYKSTSCTAVDGDAASVTYTNITARNTTRYTNANGDRAIQTNEIADLIRKMYESFTISQELLLNKVRPTTSDVQIQCDSPKKQELSRTHCRIDSGQSENAPNKDTGQHCESLPPNKYDKELLKSLIPAEERECLMKKFVEELEDWKEQQQEIFKTQLKQKEEYHLELLSQEWTARRSELEGKLNRGIEQCRNLASDLSRATEDFRLRGYRNTEREKKLMQAKQSLEQHYTTKLQELREASQKMQDDTTHQLKLKDMQVEQLEAKLEQVAKENETLKNDLKNIEKDSASRDSGLTKDQVTNLVQEMRSLEEKLDNAEQSKAFFKEQWGRAVREVHFIKLQNRKQLLEQLNQDRKQLYKMGPDDLIQNGQEIPTIDKNNLQRLKDDFYVNLLASSPPITADITRTLRGSSSFVDGISFSSDGLLKRPLDDKLNRLTEERDKLVLQENPNEKRLHQLNQEIRKILLNCGT